MDIIFRIVSIILGYCFGLFQTAYIMGRMKGIDIREYGSGNSGTTNASRVLGKKAGILVFIGDFMKAVICGFIIRMIFSKVDPDMVGILVLYSGLGVVLGHNFPFYMGFKGGKGIAATSGAVVAFGDVKVIAICLAVFLVTVLVSRYMSLASLVVVTSFLINIIVWGQCSHLGFPGSYVHADHLLECYILAAVFTGLAFYKHKDNIKRLATGTERRLGDPKDQIHI